MNTGPPYIILEIKNLNCFQKKKDINKKISLVFTLNRYGNDKLNNSILIKTKGKMKHKNFHVSIRKCA